MCEANGRCGSEPAYWRAQFADASKDQAKLIKVAAALAPVHCVRILRMVLRHPHLTPDWLAHVTLRVVQPPDLFHSPANVGYLVSGDHRDAVAAIEKHSGLGHALVMLARTWHGTVEDLATAALATSA